MGPGNFARHNADGEALRRSHRISSHPNRRNVRSTGAR